MWDQIVQALTNFFDKPIAIAGTTVGGLLASVLIVLSKTSIGKKSISKLSSLHDNLESKFNDLKSITSKAKDDADKFIENLKNEYETKLQFVLDEKNELQQLVLNIADNIHNGKVESLVEGYKNKLKETAKGQIEIVETKLSDIKDEAVQLKENLQKQFNEQITLAKAELLNEKLLLESLIKEYKEKIENFSTEIKESVKSEIENAKDTYSEIKDTVKSELEAIDYE